MNQTKSIPPEYQRQYDELMSILDGNTKDESEPFDVINKTLYAKFQKLNS